jgi:hypothetical protein
VRDSWLKLLDSVLRPARPRLERCLREREAHLAARQLVEQERAQAIARCVARIESARAEVFAANDGVVTSRMGQLEREWRMLSRPDPDGGMMDLWARVAPASWIDRKRWRDSAPAARIDAAIALAADVEGVEAAEAALAALRAALGPRTAVGARLRWRALAYDFDGTSELLAEPLHAALEALSARGEPARAVVLERARDLEREVLEAASVQIIERPLLAGALAHAAFVDHVWRAAGLLGRTNPVTSLRDLWSTGYVLSAIDASGVIVEIPPL